MKSVFLVMTLGIVSTALEAANVTVNAEGVFSEYSDPEGFLPFSEPSAGSVFSIEFVYDDATPGQIVPSNPNIAFYGNAISSISLSIGGDTFNTGDNSDIYVSNDLGSNSNFDVWNALTVTKVPTGEPDQYYEHSFGLGLESFSGSPLSSTALVQPFTSPLWTRATIYYNVQLINGFIAESSAYARADISNLTVVPTPAAVWLLSSALGFLGWMRRKSVASE